MDDRVWLAYPNTGGTFHCPAEAAEAWMARGWEKLPEPPAEPDTTKDPLPLVVDEPAPAADEPTEDAEAAPEPEE